MELFEKIFGKQSEGKSKYEDAKALFEQGVKAANDSNFVLALEYYTRSIEVYGNPAPYLNRARILKKKIRYWEALEDLLKAKMSDTVQAKEFGADL